MAPKIFNLIAVVALIAVAPVTALFSGSSANLTDPLVSLDAPVTALFSGSSANLTADPAVAGGGWVSTAFAAVPDHAHFPESVDVDLGACALVSSITLFAAADGLGGFPTAFSLALGDPQSPRWRLALSVDNATAPAAGAPASFAVSPGALGRFVRLSVARVSGGAAPARWASLRRLQVFGQPVQCPAADPGWPPIQPWPPVCDASVRSVTVQGLAATDAAAAAVVVDSPAPRIGWTLAACARGEQATAFRVTVGSAPGSSDAWDSGRVAIADGGDDTGAAYGGAALRQATLFFVSVTLFDAAGSPTPPAAARFITAKLSPLAAAWSGAWVGTGLPSAHQAVYLKSSFDIPAGRAVVRAIATFCGLGYGELSIDGAKLGDLVLSPGWTQYNARSQYLTFEVPAAQLPAGTHELSMVLGDGWYSISKDPWVHGLEKAVYVSAPKAIVDLEVTFADGGRVVYCSACNTTSQWLWSYGEITRPWIGAEDIDARLAGVRNWLPAATVSGPNEQFPGSLLVAQVELPTRVQAIIGAPQLHTVGPSGPVPYIGGGEFAKANDDEMVYWVPFVGSPSNATVKHMLNPGACSPCSSIDACGNLVVVTDAFLAALATSPNNFSCSMLPTRSAMTAHVFDFGREFQGWARVTMTGPRGANATIMHCGSMYGGCDATTSPSETGGPDLSTFTLAGTGAPETWEPRFMYTSVKTLVVKHDATIDPASVTVEGVFVAMDAPTVGAFASSDATYSWLHDAVVRTQANYITGMPNDPTREKKGWTQDVETMGPSALLVHGASALRMYSRWVSDILDNQAPDGELPEVAPGPVLNDGYNGAWWGGMGVFGPAMLYGFSGLAAEHLLPRYDAMRAYVLYLNGSALHPSYDVTWGLGDWLATTDDCRTNSSLVNTPALAHYAGVLAAVAPLVGRGEDAPLFASLAHAVRDSYFSQYYDGSMLAPREQCTQALALGLELGLPGTEAELFVPTQIRPALEAALLSLLAAANFTLTTGFVAFQGMLRVLYDLDAAAGHAMLMNRDGAGPWLNTAGSDNSLCKEMWSGGDAEMPSLCGPLASWSFASVAGLRPPGSPASSASAATAADAPVASSPGWREVVVKPNVGVGGISWADAGFEAPRGPVNVSWTLVPGAASGSVDAQEGAQGAVVRLFVSIPPGSAGVVHVPTLDAASVTESGAPAASAPGVRFVRQAGSRAVFRVDSGAYAFEAQFAP